MASKTSYLLGILAVIILGTLLYVNFCSACSLTQDEGGAISKESVSIKILAPKPIYDFSIEDGDYAISVRENFNFNVSTPSFLMPISAELKNGITKLKDYLEAHPEKEIKIVGMYADSEENTSSFPNLGLARANSVKNHLVVSGISSNRIKTEGESMEDLMPREGVYLGPISFNIMEMDSIEQQP